MNLKSLLLLLFTTWVVAQENNLQELTFNEYLGYVKKYHPLVKSAGLEINQAQANLMMARGGFDPKIEVDFEQKKFKDSEYYSILNSSFKIPTWYGIEVKAGFDNNEGIYLNPENTVPNQGLTSFGISVPIGQGLFINQRMADLRKAKIQLNLSQAERNLMAVAVLYDASVAYFNWKRNHNEVKLYENYLSNAQIRFNGVSRLIKEGDKPAIDSVEAGIIVRNRKLSLEESKLKLTKSKLELANFLWLENNVPLELQENIIPEEKLELTIRETLRTNELMMTPSLENHPKINALENKIQMLDVERKLKANMLLPKIDLGYSYLSEPSYIDNNRFQDYKVGVNFAFPIFLRKERGSLKLTKIKLQNAQFDLDLERVQLKNKINAQQAEITSLEKQKNYIDELVTDYSTMLNSEERLFSFGESSIFLINSRENNLVSAQLSQLSIENKFFESNASLFKIMANPE
ncbi:MAG: TolC family protein [Flavobacterium sp.]|jgi:outer membrane protein TolC|uniref:TolC family protein n=1 Tax=Flavobacterium macrobrachii TaxID=591204 RepID=A0ABS2CUW2_9FLAO|nr:MULTISPECIES: TolC family protein [Flavobacterium]MBM6498763.1 TolC family protein [Flavobacterium macrobrachii]MCZ8089590.1 TolC family protein [Flavobacterium sp.]MCZ8331321.1 TolC family protein [Flavobacterium sp.]PZO28717.1 MAG: transporter [Flavobacteriaceae bacterium]